jgi:hypothetical protein
MNTDRQLLEQALAALECALPAFNPEDRTNHDAAIAALRARLEVQQDRCVWPACSCYAPQAPGLCRYSPRPSATALASQGTAPLEQPQRASHPIQPLMPDAHGVLRFKENRLVSHLLEVARENGCSLNELACMGFSQDDREQFAQLIGYSLRGFGELSYVRDETYHAAEAMASGAEQPQPDVHSVAGASSEASTTPPYGCHCDIENTVNGEPDGCVFDGGRVEDCIYATILKRRGQGRDACEYWQPIAAPSRKSAAGAQEPNVQDLTPASERLSQLEAMLEKARAFIREVPIAQGWEPDFDAILAELDAALGKEKQ